MLPLIRTPEEFARVARAEEALKVGVRAVCDRHHLGHDVVRYADGSLPVYAIGDRVLKLYPQLYLSERDVEARALALVSGRLPIPTPALEAVGEVDGWGYVLMSRLRGESLATAWDSLSGIERERVAAGLGEAIAALHAIDDAELAAFPPGDWDAFLRQQRAGVVAQQEKKGLTQPWLERIPAWLNAVELVPTRRVLLHTEIMREHLRIEGGVLSGLFDFEPAMFGAAEYELASIGVFASCGDAQLLRRILLAYGYPQSALDEALTRRMCAYALLHRYSNMSWYLKRLPPPAAPTLDAFAAAGWGL
jgi:hygromycin-B 7''-O-kinase